MRILVIDKLASYRKKIRGWLMDGGHREDGILEAGSGAAAMELLRREEFNIDAILCEWEQAAVGAANLIQQLRAVPGFTHIGFIAIGPSRPAEMNAAKSLGVTQYMSQPLDPEELLQSLVAVEKSAIAHRKRVPSPTTRWRILANDSRPSPKPPDGAMHAAELELRKGASPVFLKAGECLELRQGSPLYWIDSGHLLVTESRTDGAVLEYRLGPGQFVGEAPFGGCAINSLSARADGDVWVCSRSASLVDELRQRHPVLFYSFRTIATERARKYQKTAEKQAVERGLAGEVESLPVGDLIGILNGARKTGVLRLQTPERTFYIQFVGGTIRHAECDGEVGEEVFYAAILISKGHFEFMVGPEVEGPVTVAGNTQSILLEGLKRRATHVSKSPRTHP